MTKIWAIVWKDLISELRTKELLTPMFTFALLTMVIFNFAFDLSAELVPIAAPAILWVAFTFAGVLGLGRSFALEKEGNTILGVLLTPTDRSLIFLGKMIGNVIFVFITALIIIPTFVLLFNYNLGNTLLPLLLVVLLGTIGFVSVGTLFSAIASNTRLREVLLPILLFPIIIPVIVSSVKLTGAILAGKSMVEENSALQILISFDIIFLVACSVLFEYVVEE
ncbi:MAG TPA: heme exporter protein CcmB [Thermodesulfobacteriota bacterium]|nr:heme exporter protein CcmB [Thermodesulfobacteriota bacterium]